MFDWSLKSDVIFCGTTCVGYPSQAMNVFPLKPRSKDGQIVESTELQEVISVIVRCARTERTHHLVVSRPVDARNSVEVSCNDKLIVRWNSVNHTIYRSKGEFHLCQHPPSGAQKQEDSSAMNSAPNKGNSMGSAPLKEKGLNKGDYLLDSQIHTPPSKQVPSPFLCPRGWAMGRGRGMRREGAEKSIYYYFFAKPKIIWFFKSVSLVWFFQFIRFFSLKQNH